jgi:lysozyme
MKTGTKAIELIKEFENFEPKAYICPAGKNTIGYGHVISNYEDLKVITLQQATDLLMSDLVRYENIVNRKINVQLNQNQFDALVSHTYNTGGSDTLFRLINNAGTPIFAVKEWWEGRYVTGGGKVLNGLVRRRKAEYKLYTS